MKDEKVEAYEFGLALGEVSAMLKDIIAILKEESTWTLEKQKRSLKGKFKLLKFWKA